MRQHLTHDESFVTRFRREARSARRCRTPTSSPCSTRARTTAASSSRWSTCPGQTLRDVMREEGLLSPRAALDVLEPVLLALAEAPTQGPDPPRRQARERHHQRQRHGQGRRLRAGPGGRPARPSPAPRACCWAPSPTSPPSRSSAASPTPAATSTPRADALRDAHRHQGVHRRHRHPRRLPARARRGARARRAGSPACRRRSTTSSPSPPRATPTSGPADAGEFLALVRRTRATLSAGALDARPAGLAARPPLPAHGPTALPVQRAHAAPDDAGGGRHPPALRDRRHRPSPPAARGPGRRRRPGARRRRRWWPAVAGLRAHRRPHGVVLPARPRRTATVPSVQGRTRPRRSAPCATPRSTRRSPRRSARRSQRGRHLGRPRAGQHRGPRVRRGARGLQGPGAVCRATGRRHDARRGQRADREVNLTVGKVTKAYNEKVPEGQVVAAKPGPGRA